MIKSFQNLSGQISNYTSLQLFIVIFQILLDWCSPLELSIIKCCYNIQCGYETLKQKI